jgi:hypothetical protein
MNKTGTTSISTALTQLGYTVADQAPAEMLIRDWAKRDFMQLIDFCQTADAFQDIPFSLPFTYQALDQHYPNSKFILTIRGSVDEWYQSLTKFHTKLFGEGQIPSAKQLQAATYRYPGFVYDSIKLVYDTPDDDLYNYETLNNQYHRHQANVISYFCHRPEQLLVLNVADGDAYYQLCDFLGKPRVNADFPWENKTDTITHRAI